MSIPPSSRLAEVQAAFADWRQNRTGQRFPRALREQAVALLADHRISEVMATLRVDHRALTRWRRERSQLKSNTPGDEFIELPPAAEPRASRPAPPTGVSMTLSRQDADGRCLSVSGQLSEAQWRWALALLQEVER